MISHATDLSLWHPNASEFQKLECERQRKALRELRDLGASVRQLQRLTGLGRGLIQRI